jgi:ATP-binding cassette, subfamily C, bacterial exporter for protease/lipase
MSEKRSGDGLEARGLLPQSIRSLRAAFVSVGLFSCVLNLLMLTSSIFMLQVYDRVLSSRSIPTLIALSALALAMYSFSGVFELLRMRVMSRAGFWLDGQLGLPTFRHWLARSLAGTGESTRPLTDIAVLRQFLTSPGLMGIYDVPWIPIYLVFVFLIHWKLGLLTVGGALVVFVLAVLNERSTRAPLKQASAMEATETQFLEQAQRNAESILPMGMLKSVASHWSRMHGEGARLAQDASETGEYYSSASKTFRMLLQSAMLGLAAYLVLRQEISSGMIIAANIISGRALAPIDQVIGQWKIVARSRQAYQRLSLQLANVGQTAAPLQLPEPKGALQLRGVTKYAPDPTGQQKDARRILLQQINLVLEPGDALGVIGPSASGKTTLARVLIGSWVPDAGAVRLDGASYDQWDLDLLGRHIGYLPQGVELLAGTVHQNIARFDSEAKDEDVVKAAQMAGVHDMILRLPQGYASRIGYGAIPLSGGQVQRIGLARALFRLPHLVVLDEPNSNLDAEGDAGVTAAIENLRKAGSIVIVMAHRPSAIAAVNKLMMLQSGAVVEFGDKNDVLRKVTRQPGS